MPALHRLGFIFYFEFVCKVNLFLRGLLFIICTVDSIPAVLSIVKNFLCFPNYFISCIYIYLHRNLSFPFFIIEKVLQHSLSCTVLCSTLIHSTNLCLCPTLPSQRPPIQYVMPSNQ